jgi:5'-3' exonuclease
MKKQELFKLFDNIDREEGNESTFKITDRILLIDGMNLFLRNFAVLNYVNEAGVHIGGLSGFLRSLGSLINQIKPTSVYIIFDGIGSSTNRKNLIPEYKSGRNVNRVTNWDVFEDLDDEHNSKIDQISRLVHYLRCLPLKVISIDKVEADDIIAHISDYLSKTHDSKCFIVSADKDFLQLVNDNITVYRPTEREFYTPETIIKKFDILPENFILYKTLLGDASDKITGIKGLGPKTLVQKFPELRNQILTLKDIFDISEKKYKDHVIYSRIIFERDNLEKNYRVMDLKNPLIYESEKDILEKAINQSPNELSIANFMQLHNEDGLNHAINKNISYWLQDIFVPINNFNKSRT